MVLLWRCWCFVVITCGLFGKGGDVPSVKTLDRCFRNVLFGGDGDSPVLEVLLRCFRKIMVVRRR